VRPGEAGADPAQLGDVEVAVVEPGHRAGQGDLAQAVDLRVGGAGEGDPRLVTNPAACAVAARQVSGGYPVGSVRAAYLGGHPGAVLADPGHLVPAPDVGAKLPGALAEQALKSRLREMRDPHRRIRQAREVQLQAAERGPRRRANAAAAGRLDPAQQA